MQATDSLIEQSPYRIVDQDGFRCLRLKWDDITLVSCMRLNDPDAIISHYLAAMLQWPVLVPPKDVLEIGLGGGQVAKFIRKHLPDTRYVAVENDPTMLHIARRYFGLPADDERLSVVLGDGGDYVRSHPDSCDVMLIDACDHSTSEAGFPESMVGEVFCAACHDALRPDGVLAMNVFRRSEPWRLEYQRTLGQFFPKIFMLAVSEDQQVLLAFKRFPQLDWAVLSQRVAMLEPQLRLGLPVFLTAFEACVKGAEQAALA